MLLGGIIVYMAQYHLGRYVEYVVNRHLADSRFFQQ